MITYQRTEQDEPQPVDENGCLPDGTQVIHYPDDGDYGVIRLDAGIFNGGNETLEMREI